METKKQEDRQLPEPPAPRKIEPPGSFRSVLSNRSFVLLWLAQLISQIGFNAANFGVLTTVATITGGSGIMSGIAIISFTLPAVPFSLLAGVYVDYLDKRLVLWVSNALRAIATLLIVLALIWNPRTVLPLFFLNFFISMVTQFFMPAESSAIPLLVGKRNLVPALSLFNITLNVAQAIGFLLLGRLIESIFSSFSLPLGLARVTITPHDMLFAVVAVGYLLCTALILAIPHTKLRSLLNGEQRLPRSPGKQMWAIVQRDIKGSWQLIRKDRHLYLALLQVSFVSVLLLVIGQLAPVFVQKILGLPADDLTILFAPAGFGLVLGGLFMPLLATYISKSRMITLGSIVTAIGLILLPVGQLIAHSTPFFQGWELAIVGVVAFFLGIALDMINIPAQTVMQERAPEEERGRVLSFQFMLYNAGSIPVLLFAGVITDTLGIATVLYSLGAAILLFQWWASRSGHSKKGPDDASAQDTRSETDYRTPS
jgi:Na+/melibiose symporter-like transporter